MTLPDGYALASRRSSVELLVRHGPVQFSLGSREVPVRRHSVEGHDPSHGILRLASAASSAKAGELPSWSERRERLVMSILMSAHIVKPHHIAPPQCRDRAM
jgi:hypothetical protein